MNANELREKSVDELNNQLVDLLREQFNLSMKRGTGQLAKPHLISEVRHNIARVTTVLTEKAGAA